MFLTDALLNWERFFLFLICCVFSSRHSVMFHEIFFILRWSCVSFSPKYSYSNYFSTTLQLLLRSNCYHLSTGFDIILLNRLLYILLPHYSIFLKPHLFIFSNINYMSLCRSKFPMVSYLLELNLNSLPWLERPCISCFFHPHILYLTVLHFINTTLKTYLLFYYLGVICSVFNKCKTLWW